MRSVCNDDCCAHPDSPLRVCADYPMFAVIPILFSSRRTYKVVRLSFSTEKKWSAAALPVNT